MTFEPILNAPVEIQFHIIVATLSLVVGPFALYRKRRDRVHKTLGYVWVCAMAATAVSSFFIHSFPLIGPFSPIHGFAIVTLWSLWTGMRHIFKGRVQAHAIHSRSLYWRGLCVAGLVNFLPGRTMNQAVLGESQALGYVVITVGLVLLFSDVLLRITGGVFRGRPAHF